MLPSISKSNLINGTTTNHDGSRTERGSGRSSSTLKKVTPLKHRMDNEE